MKKDKKKDQTKSSDKPEFCETCSNPAHKCKNGCKGVSTDNETSKQFNKKI